jgi:CheY-like chemotaxis protein
MILLIDDNETERALTRKILEGGGYAVREAADGAEGLAIFRETKPDLVLCDLMMPGKNGFDTVRELRALAPTARIVAISGVLFGVADHDTMKEALGLAGVVEKPFRPARLLQAVRDALE